MPERPADGGHPDMIHAARASVCRRYFDALEAGAGVAAAGLFTPDGVLDDLLGGHHQGQSQIRDFINERPSLQVQEPLRVLASGDRLNVYGALLFDPHPGFAVRWIFAFEGDAIRHLSISRVRRPAVTATGLGVETL